MDVFARTFLAAASHAGLSQPVIARHFALYRRCLGSDEPVLVVSRCLRPERPWAGEHLLALTRKRLVVTHESRVLRRIRLHLDAPIRELADAWWSADPRQVTAELAVTAADGVRERFEFKARHLKALWQLDAAFGYVFRAAVTAMDQPVPIPNIVRVPR
jgi:hypothetical protein